MGHKRALQALINHIESSPELINFELDIYVLSPYGLSCNGIARNGSEDYVALHQSPQSGVNYLSIETNSSNWKALFRTFQHLFEPKRYEMGQESYCSQSDHVSFDNAVGSPSKPLRLR